MMKVVFKIDYKIVSIECNRKLYELNIVLDKY